MRVLRDTVFDRHEAGTLAVEAALKLARKVTGRSNVIAFTGGFHGASLGSLAASSSPVLRGAAGLPLAGVSVMPYDGFLGDQDTAAVLEAMLRPGSGIDRPAAVLLETVQGEGGPTWSPPLRAPRAAAWSIPYRRSPTSPPRTAPTCTSTPRTAGACCSATPAAGCWPA